MHQQGRMRESIVCKGILIIPSSQCGMVMGELSKHDGQLGDGHFETFGSQSHCEQTITENRIDTGEPELESLRASQAVFASEPSAKSVESHPHQCQSVVHASIFKLSISNHNSKIFGVFVQRDVESCHARRFDFKAFSLRSFLNKSGSKSAALGASEFQNSH